MSCSFILNILGMSAIGTIYVFLFNNVGANGPSPLHRILNCLGKNLGEKKYTKLYTVRRCDKAKNIED